MIYILLTLAILSIMSALISSAAGSESLFAVMKTIPLLIYMTYLVYTHKKTDSKFIIGGLIALIFGAIAGVVIIYNFELGTFLWYGTHLSWIIIIGFGKGDIIKRALLFLPAFITSSIMIVQVIPKTEGILLFIVIGYAILQPSVSGVALIRHFHTEKSKNSMFFLIGALLFLLSDILLASNRWLFTEQTPLLNHRSIIIQGTYLIGVALMVMGVPKKELKVE